MSRVACFQRQPKSRCGGVSEQGNRGAWQDWRSRGTWKDPPGFHENLAGPTWDKRRLTRTRPGALCHYLHRLPMFAKLSKMYGEAMAHCRFNVMMARFRGHFKLRLGHQSRALQPSHRNPRRFSPWRCPEGCSSRPKLPSKSRSGPSVVHSRGAAPCSVTGGGPGLHLLFGHPTPVRRLPFSSLTRLSRDVLPRWEGALSHRRRRVTTASSTRPDP